jgi:eukaryotic-like serine/threonine-protein kinase
VDTTLSLFTPRVPGDPAVIGPYTILGRLGQGGMGTVYLGRTDEGHQAAVKLVRPELARDADFRRRFATEVDNAQRVASFCTAAVLGHGAYGDRPYLATEYIDGPTLQARLDGEGALPHGALQSLAVGVAAALTAIHAAGLVHRDLKPSNILVAEHDGHPVPKVIDFGLAKALGEAARLTDASVFTAAGAVVGTPLYMAPEQVGAGPFDVDTRADVYALGVILYELLTGTTPLEKERLRAAAWDEVRRVIREEDPPRPSTRLSSTDAAASIAAQRDTEPARLNRLVRGDLDWIVMRALEKDRNRRYETAQSLAQDVQRYLAGDAVEASPPSRRYRFGKFVRRNRGAVLAAGLLFVSLVAGLAGTTWGLLRAERARAAEAERADAEARAVREAAVQRDRAVEAEKHARLEAATATAVEQFLQSDLLEAGNPYLRSGADPDPKMRDVLRRAARQIEGRFADQPLVEAAVRTTLGNALNGVGAPAEAVPHLERALALYRAHRRPDHPDTLAAMNNLSVAYWYVGPPPEAIAHAQQSFEKHREAGGPDAASSLDAQMILGVMYLQRADPHKAVPVLRTAAGANSDSTAPTTSGRCGRRFTWPPPCPSRGSWPGRPRSWRTAAPGVRRPTAPTTC